MVYYSSTPNIIKEMFVIPLIYGWILENPVVIMFVVRTLTSSIGQIK
jgi:hypothetical protein